jgi:hypothetical protein
MKPLVSESSHPDHGLAGGIGRDSEKYILRGTTGIEVGICTREECIAVLYNT